MQNQTTGYRLPSSVRWDVWWILHGTKAKFLMVLVVLIFGISACSVVKNGKKEPAACKQFLLYWQEGLKNDAGLMLAIPTPLTEYAFGRAHILEFYPPRRRVELDSLAVNGGRGYLSAAAVERQGADGWR